MFGGLGDLANVLKQAKSLQQNMQRVQEELRQKTVEGTAGGGMVTTTVNGQGLLTAIKISPEVADPNDVEMLEDLVKAAVADGQAKAQRMTREALSEVTGGLDLGGLQSLLGGGS